MKVEQDGRTLGVRLNYGTDLRNSLTETGAIKGESHEGYGGDGGFERYDPPIYVTLDSERGYSGIVLRLADAEAFARAMLDHVSEVRNAWKNYEREV